MSHVLPLCLQHLLVRVHSLRLFGATGEEPRRAAGAAIRREEETPPARSSWTGEQKVDAGRSSHVTNERVSVMRPDASSDVEGETFSYTNNCSVCVWGVAPPLVNRCSCSKGVREHCEEAQPGLGEGNVFFGRQRMICCFNQRTFSL